MTRKHFVEIADTLEKELKHAQGEEQETIASLTRTLARTFKSINRHFNFETFYRACGLDEKGFPQGASQKKGS